MSCHVRGLWAVPLILLGALLFARPAAAQSAHAAPSPSVIQTMIASGQETQAIHTLQNILQTHPKSGVAWYLLAEAYDAQNNESAAGSALNMAVRSDPGLSFANPQRLAALRQHIAGAQPRTGVNGTHTALLVIGGLVLLMIVLHFMRGRNVAQSNYGYTQPPPPPGTPPYGTGYGPFNGGGGGGLGRSIIGGLAAGAGFAAGERIIDGMMGPQQGGSMINPQQQGPDLSRDDGLMGDPGWGDSGGMSDDSNLDDTGWS